MAKITLSGFSGANQKVQSRLLNESVGMNSVNQRPGGGDLAPWMGLQTVATGLASSLKSIYRFGRDVDNDAQYWFSSPNVCHYMRGFNATDTSERTYFTGEDKPRVTDSVIGAISSPPYPTAWRYLGVPAPTAAITLTQDAAGTGTDERRFYVQTFVTDRGEESAPSPTNSIVCKPGATINFNTLEAAPSNHGITKRRFYRTQASETGEADFFLILEVSSDTLTGVTDANLALGAATLATTGFLPPPADLKHLTPLWNGMAAGISGRSVRVCEPYKPYAWSIANELLTADSTPVALATFSSQLLILTNGKPRLATGGIPSALNDEALEFDASCVSARSPVSFGHGVVWASADGLAYYGQGGGRILTRDLLRPEQWRALFPETIIGAQYEGIYIGFYFDGTAWKGFCIDPMNPSGIYFLSAGYQAVHYDRLRNSLYVYSGTTIKKWNADPAALMQAKFTSKRFMSPKPVSMARLRVTAETYSTAPAPIALTIFADGAPIGLFAAYSDEPITLPSGIMAREWVIDVMTYDRVVAVEMATSIAELKGG